MNPLTERFLEALEATTGDSARTSGNGWLTRCPAHDDRNPSLLIAEGEEGRVLVHCHAGCLPDDICSSIGLELRNLMTDDPGDIDKTSSIAEKN